jgi:hypothetical protein
VNSPSAPYAGAHSVPHLLFCFRTIVVAGTAYLLDLQKKTEHENQQKHFNGLVNGVQENRLYQHPVSGLASYF